MLNGIGAIAIAPIVLLIEDVSHSHVSTEQIIVLEAANANLCVVQSVRFFEEEDH